MFYFDSSVYVSARRGRFDPVAGLEFHRRFDGIVRLIAARDLIKVVNTKGVGPQNPSVSFFLMMRSRLFASS